MHSLPFILAKQSADGPEVAQMARSSGKNFAPKLGAWFCLVSVITCVISWAPVAAGAETVDPLGINQALGLLPAPQTDSASSVTAASPAVPATAAPVTAPATTSLPQTFDYSANLASDAFGAQLFTGAFAKQSSTQFNPDYLIAVGDRVQVRFWGAFDYGDVLTVDPPGNIFLPHVGPVQVLGVRNKDVQKVVEAAVKQVFRANVFCYASLAAAQPVRVYVGGFVNRPGLYNGTSMDSLLYYLDQAGGIDPERGSFLNVQVKRGDTVRLSANLYDFLLDGVLPLIQLGDGDVVFVMPRQNTVKVTGLAENAKRFEFSSGNRKLADVIRIAKPLAQATHVRVTRSTGTTMNVDYYPLGDAGNVELVNGDMIEFTADKKPGSITVRVEGEHDSPQEYVLPYGARLGDVLKGIKLTPRSDAQDLQLFRVSVKTRQKLALQTSLNTLANVALTARSGTSEEARLRTDEANLLLQWVARAKQVEPSGQVLLSQSSTRDDLPLENGDVLRVPPKDGLVLINGEVLFPNAIAYDGSLDLNDYIRLAGGYTQNADTSRVVIAHLDGSFSEAGGSSVPESSAFSWEDSKPARVQLAGIRAGDQIMVLPKVDVKSRQIAKELTQILYQIAVSAKVVLGL